MAGTVEKPKKNCGFHTLVNFNVDKTQCCLISRRVDKNLPNISFDSNLLKVWNKISMLDIIRESELCWNGHISSVAKPVASKLGFWFRARRLFTSTQLVCLQGSNSPLSQIGLASMEWVGPPSILLPAWI